MTQEDTQKLTEFCATQKSSELLAVLITVLSGNTMTGEDFMRRAGVDPVGWGFSLKHQGMIQQMEPDRRVANEINLRMPVRSA